MLSEELCHLLSGVPIQLPELHEIPEELPSIARSCINKLNQQMPIQLTGFEDGALELLKAYHWESGIAQFELVLKHLAANTTTSAITRQSVAAMLDQISSTTLAQAEQSNVGIDLTKTLDEINRDVITAVLKEENMNQTRTAKRLNISRSTLWKKLQE
ncbi:MAG: helix-turn-helix domain-containing protein [Lachnospiraceae bacterium]